MPTEKTASGVPSLKDFYEGLYCSPIYADHRRITCNVGFHPVSALLVETCSSNADSEEASEARAREELHTAAQQFHDEHTPQDRFQVQLYHELVRMMPPSLQKQSKMTILDVGCGPGGGMCALQAMFPHADLIGVDIASQAIVRGKENWLTFSKHIPSLLKKRAPQWIHQRCEQMSHVRTASCDVVSAVQTLNEVQHLTLAVDEIARVLKPGGTLLVADFVPADGQPDRVRTDLLDRARQPSSPWDFEQERLVSFNAALACKLNSPSMESLIRECIPTEFQADLETLFFVENSALYKKLHAGEMGYRLVCLRKKKSLVEESAQNPFCESTDGDEMWSTEGRDDEVYDEDDDEEDEIDDSDLANFYSYRDLFPELEVLKTHYATILEEVQAVQAATSWPFWPEKHYTEEESEWRVFPFCYTFPADDASKTKWVDATCALCPQTVEVLKSIPGIRTALFSKLGPNTTLGAHRGWADLSNHILRCHIGLVVPTLENGKPCCSMIVGGEEVCHEEREIIVFDDSKLHYAFNHHPNKTRLVLIVDLYRPDHLPRGRAVGGHTDELDEFIEAFERQAMESDA